MARPDPLPHMTQCGAVLLRTLAALEDPAIRRATSFIGPKETLKITRARRLDRREKAETYIMTYGVPNYAERQFIKDAIAAGEPFPVKKVRLQSWPTKR